MLPMPSLEPINETDLFARVQSDVEAGSDTKLMTAWRNSAMPELFG